MYIVLWLIALWALAYAFLSTSNAQKGWEVVSKIQDKLVTAIAKNQKVKDKTTIVDHINDLDWLTIGSYKLSKSPVTVYNVNWDEVVTWWAFKWTETLPTTTAWTLQLVMMPNAKIQWTANADKLSLTKGQVDGAAINTDVNEQLRWFLATGYVWFGTFDSDTTAKDFRDSYFSTWMLVKDSAGKYAVMIEIAR